MSARPAIEPYDPAPREVAPGLWVWDGDWKQSAFRRRMTLIRLPGGGVLVHNAMRLREADYGQVDRIGPVEGIVAPNFFHSSEAHVYRLRYPQAKLFVSARAAAALRKLAPVEGVLPGDWPWQETVPCLEFQGTRLVGESVFLHRPSRTLIATDVVFNVQRDVRGATRMLYKLNRIYKRFGPTSLLRWVFVNDAALAGASVRRILEWDFDRVIMNHGDVLESGGKAAFERGFREIGLL